MSISFKATKVFDDVWNAINETFINEKGKEQRKYRLFEEVGGSRSSKTWSNFQIIFLYGMQSLMKKIVVMRDTAVDCRDKVETDWIQWLKDPNTRVKEYEEGLITIEELDAYLKVEDLTQYMIQNKSNHSWTFKQSGSIITFTGTDDEDRAIGKSQNVLWVNEPYRFNEEVFKQLTQRTSDFIIVDWNPKQNHFIEKQRLKPDTFTHYSSLLDNPFCPIESRKQITSYQPLKYSRVVKDGLLPIKEATSYDLELNSLKFNRKDLLELKRCILNEQMKTSSEYHYLVFFLGLKAEKPNRIFSWKKITRAEYDALDCGVMYGVDWGKVDPWGIVEAKFYDGTLYLRELNYKSENELRKEMNVNESIKIGEDAEGTGIVVWMFNRLGISKNAYIVCDNNRPLKIAALKRHGWEYAIEAQKPKGSIIDGISLLENIPVCYTDDSPNIEYEQENYSWKTDRYGINTEEPEDANNHIAGDPARYIALFLQSKGLLRVL